MKAHRITLAYALKPRGGKIAKRCGHCKNKFKVAPLKSASWFDDCGIEIAIDSIDDKCPNCGGRVVTLLKDAPMFVGLQALILKTLVPRPAV